MKNVLVTGGGGFIGLSVVRRLREMGVQTTVVGRNEYPEVLQLGGCCLQGDIRDLAFMRRAVNGMDTVFHVAAKAGVWGDLQAYASVNINGTQNIVEACKNEGVKRLVYTSTPSVVFDGRSIRGGDETLPYAKRPLCHYAATKIEAEKIVLTNNSERLLTTALRPHLVWGPGDTNLIPRLLDRARSGSLRIVGSGKNKVDISYIDNVAEAHIIAARNLATAATAAGESFFISQGEAVCLWDWINELFTLLDMAPLEKKVSMKVAYMTGWVMEQIYTILGRRDEPIMTRFVAEQLSHDHWFSIEKAKKVIGYRPIVSTQSGLQQLVLSLKSRKKNSYE